MNLDVLDGRGFSTRDDGRHNRLHLRRKLYAKENAYPQSQVVRRIFHDSPYASFADNSLYRGIDNSNKSVY